MIVDRKFYKAKDLYAAYDTEQVFLDRDHGRLRPAYGPLAVARSGALPAAAAQRAFSLVYGVVGYDWTTRPIRVPEVLKRKPKLAIVAQLNKLPPDLAVKRWHELNALGAF